LRAWLTILINANLQIGGVEHVSIIGVKEGVDCIRRPQCEAMDGVVAYDSSRFSPPEDELIVKAGHGVHRHPQAIRFLLNRLRQWMQAPKGPCL
jgi:hypothetical protein